MSNSVQPSSSPIAGSRSRGTATSTSTSGFSRGRTASAWRIGYGQRVAEMTRSASGSSTATASNAAARPPTRSARSCALSSVRLETTTSAPRARRSRAASSLIFPAPNSSARLPSTPPSSRTPSSTAEAATDSGSSCSFASVRTRLPACSASSNSRFSSAPVAPRVRADSYASRTWPRICDSPGTSESSPAATRKRCETASPSSQRASTPSSSSPERSLELRARALGVAAERGRSRCGCRSRARPPRRAPRPARAACPSWR